MIGRRCKARERLSRAPLIGRALRDRLRSPPLPTVLKKVPSSSAVRPPGRLGSAAPPFRSPRRNAPRGPAATAAGAHPDPYRTRKLSRPAPRVLQGRPCGRLGRRRPPGRVARARGGEARHKAPGKEGPDRVPFSFMSAMCAPIPHIYIHVHFSSLTYDAWYRERGVTVDSAEGFAVSPPY